MQKSYLRMEFHFHSINVSISSPYAKKLDLEGKKEIEVGDGTIASAGSTLGIVVWSSISGRLVDALPFGWR